MHREITTDSNHFQLFWSIQTVSIVLYISETVSSSKMLWETMTQISKHNVFVDIEKVVNLKETKS